MKEAIEQGVDMEYTPPKVHCTAFEDNTGMVELVSLPKICQCTKHLSSYYHHLQLYTSGHDPEISIWLVGTENLMFTKLLTQALFVKFHQ